MLSILSRKKNKKVYILFFIDFLNRLLYDVTMKNDDTLSYGQKLKEAIEKSGDSIPEAARRIGLSTPALRYVIYGRNKLRREKEELFENLYKVKLSEKSRFIDQDVLRLILKEIDSYLDQNDLEISVDDKVKWISIVYERLQNLPAEQQKSQAEMMIDVLAQAANQ